MNQIENNGQTPAQQAYESFERKIAKIIERVQTEVGTATHIGHNREIENYKSIVSIGHQCQTLAQTVFSTHLSFDGLKDAVAFNALALTLFDKFTKVESTTTSVCFSLKVEDRLV
jgi:phosphohistidine phosphatase SixA